jgi:negative regulator of sigma-B (phosphoserine phosphatase)
MGAMTMAERDAHQVLDWAIVSRALAGQAVSGDLHLVRSFEGGALVAVIDGLGHGWEAAQAARVAADTLSGSPDAAVPDLIQSCHQALRPTRGVAMSLASFDARRDVMSWVGVGDVEGILTSAAGPRHRIILRNGVVGYRIPAPRAVDLPVRPGDTLIFATDGVRHGFAATVACGRPPRQVADDIIAEHGKFTDDALVLVVRYLGMAS